MRFLIMLIIFPVQLRARFARRIQAHGQAEDSRVKKHSQANQNTLDEVDPGGIVKLED